MRVSAQRRPQTCSVHSLPAANPVVRLRKNAIFAETFQPSPSGDQKKRLPLDTHRH
jgi:hypothetical protein